MALGKAIYSLYMLVFLTVERTKGHFPLLVSGMKINVLIGKAMACPEEVINTWVLLQQHMQAPSGVMSIILTEGFKWPLKCILL